MSEPHAIARAREVPETRLGKSFQGTNGWRRYVVLDTLVWIPATRPA
jgi:hypothetical protein